MSRKKTNILFIVMAMVAIVILIGTGTYAYYQTNIKGTTSGTIAKWDFKANNQTESFNLDFGSLYPGKSGTYNLELSAENSDLDVYYEFIIHSGWGGNMGQIFVNPYLYFDSSYTKGPIENHGDYVGKYGIIPAGQKITIPLYYNWIYNELDVANLADGQLASSPISIVGRQYTGSSETIPINIYKLDLLSYNIPYKSTIIPVAELDSDRFDYPTGSLYYFEKVDDTSGYIRVSE